MKKSKKAAIMQAMMQAHQAGVQKGAMSAQGAGGPPPPGAGAPPMAPGMKKGGFVPFGKKGEKAEGETKAQDKAEGKKGEAKEKWVPPWAKKAGGGVVKFAAGGCCRGDGIASKGRTRGTMR